MKYLVSLLIKLVDPEGTMDSGVKWEISMENDNKSKNRGDTAKKDYCS